MVISCHFNNLGVKVVLSKFNNTVSFKVGFNIHFGLSWDDSNLKYTL